MIVLQNDKVDDIRSDVENRCPRMRKHGRVKKNKNNGKKFVRRVLVDACKNNHEDNADVLYDLRRQTRGFVKINKEHFIGKLVWGQWKGWWPGKGESLKKDVSMVIGIGAF